MAIVSAIFSLLSKKLGQLLQALFGWSITGLFGKLPSSKQTALTVALALSLAWPLLVVGIFVPHVAAWAVALVPLHRWIGRAALRVVWIVLAVVAPLIVGGITHAVVPAERRKGGVLTVVLAGYPLTLGFSAAFAITLVVVPVLKLGALFRRWSDEHVFVQVRTGAYRDVLAAVARACERAGVAVTERPVPAPMRAPTRVLQWFARGALAPVIADDPRMLVGAGIELYLYPADLLLRGVRDTSAHVRAALVRELVRAPAHLTQDPRAQHIEVELDRLWDVVDRHGGTTPETREPIGAPGFARLRAVAAEIDGAQIPYEDWVLLYTDLLRLDRAMSGASLAVEPEPDAPARHAHFHCTVPAATVTPSRPREATMIESRLPTMTPVQTVEPASTSALVREALDEVGTLFRAEIALARDDMRREARGVVACAIAFAGAGAAAALGVACLLIAFALAIFPHPLAALVLGAALLIGAAIAAFVGIKALPKKPLAATRERLETDAQVIQEQFA